MSRKHNRQRATRRCRRRVRGGVPATVLLGLWGQQPAGLATTSTLCKKISSTSRLDPAKPLQRMEPRAHAKQTLTLSGTLVATGAAREVPGPTRQLAGAARGERSSTWGAQMAKLINGPAGARPHHNHCAWQRRVHALLRTHRTTQLLPAGPRQQGKSQTTKQRRQVGRSRRCDNTRVRWRAGSGGVLGSVQRAGICPKGKVSLFKCATAAGLIS